MKKIILSVAVLALSVTFAKAQTPAQPKDQHVAAPTEKAVDPKAPDMVFEMEVIDYGTIDHYADGHREFVFKNKGKSPLIISNCVGSCGCTVPTWPKEPIKPGAKAKIDVKYATDRVGAFEKTITVTSNAKTPTKVLKIKGVVKAEPATKPADATTPAATPDQAGH